jgi:hypothetical protein
LAEVAGAERVELGVAGLALGAFEKKRVLDAFCGLSFMVRIFANALVAIAVSLDFSEGFGSRFGLDSRLSFGS